jgi:hypothetical protein
MYYSTSTFERADISDPDVATCGTSIVSVIMVGISVSLSFLLVVAESLKLDFFISRFANVFPSQVLLVEHVGRRTLMLTGLAGMFVSYGLITVGYALEVGLVINLMFSPNKPIKQHNIATNWKAIFLSLPWAKQQNKLQENHHPPLGIFFHLSGFQKCVQVLYRAQWISAFPTERYIKTGHILGRHVFFNGLKKRNKSYFYAH